MGFSIMLFIIAAICAIVGFTALVANKNGDKFTVGLSIFIGFMLLAGFLVLIASVTMGINHQANIFEDKYDIEVDTIGNGYVRYNDVCYANIVDYTDVLTEIGCIPDGNELPLADEKEQGAN